MNEVVPASKRFERHWMPEPNSGCWLWLASLRGRPQWPRGAFSMGNKLIVDAHRASWLIHRGEIPNGLCVCHRCDNTFCVNPDHLFLGTQKDNIADMFRKGRENNPVLKGIAHGRAKLSVADVLAIRASKGRGIDLATKYNVTDVLIGKIRRRELWRHIP